MNKKLEELEPGDIVKIRYSFEVETFEVVSNDPKNKKLLVESDIGISMFSSKTQRAFDYNSQNIKDWYSYEGKKESLWQYLKEVFS